MATIMRLTDDEQRFLSKVLDSYEEMMEDDLSGAADDNDEVYGMPQSDAVLIFTTIRVKLIGPDAGE